MSDGTCPEGAVTISAGGAATAPEQCQTPRPVREGGYFSSDCSPCPHLRFPSDEHCNALRC